MGKIQISNKAFKTLVNQANLTLTNKQEVEIKSQLSEALNAVQILNELDTDGVPTLNHPTGDLNNVMREDKVEPSLSQDLALSGSSNQHNGYFVVKAVFDEES